jgi:hypothetical protein
VLSLGPNGHVESQASATEIIGADAELANETMHEAEALELNDTEGELGQDATVDLQEGKLIVPEEVKLGHVSRNACEFLHSKSFMLKTNICASDKLFLGNLGGRFPVLFWTQFLTGLGLSRVTIILEIWWLGYWAGQYATHYTGNVNDV